MALSAEQAANIRKFTLNVRMKAYQCGYNESANCGDSRPPSQRGSTHEMATKSRDEMEAAHNAFLNYIDELCKGK